MSVPESDPRPFPDPNRCPAVEEPLRDLYRRCQVLERRLQRLQAELRSLEDDARTTGGVARDLSRGEGTLRRDLEHLQARVQVLAKVVSEGNGTRPLTTRIAVLENDVEDLLRARDDRDREQWKLLASLVAGLLSLVSSALLWLLKGGS
jgi:prefoldin subunit 5